MQETILQFGTGNFLRGLADDFMQQLNNKGLYAGQVVVVSPTDSATVEKINAQGGRYHLLLRGLAKGQPVRRFCARFAAFPAPSIRTGTLAPIWRWPGSRRCAL